MRTTRSLFVALLCVFTALGAFAQSNNTTTGSVAGQVADASGAGLPGVTVTVVNIDTGLTRNTVTENDGAVQVTRLGRSAHVARLDILPGLRAALASLDDPGQCDRRGGPEFPSTLVDATPGGTLVKLMAWSETVLVATSLRSRLRAFPY